MVVIEKWQRQCKRRISEEFSLLETKKGSCCCAIFVVFVITIYLSHEMLFFVVCHTKRLSDMNDLLLSYGGSSVNIF